MAKKTTRRQKSFADELRQAIRDSGMTHYRIAANTGFRDRVKGALSPDQVDRFMSGGRDPRLSTVEKIVGALGLKLALEED